MKRFLLSLSVLWIAVSADATEYFIDFVAGSDSNNGTAKATPWKRHPYMVGGPGHTHQAGNRYIFKGGVTWPRECFQMRINMSGASGNSVYYGVDQTWFNGGAWSRPIFDFENNNIGSFGASGAGVFIDNADHVIIDNIEMKRHRGVFNIGGAAVNCCTLLGFGCDNLVIENCHIHDWSLPSAPGLNQDPAGGAGGIAMDQGYGAVTVSNCVIHQSNVGYYSGCAIKMGGQILWNTVSNVPNGVIGGGGVFHNHFHHIRSATDVNAHENAILQQVPGTIAYNLIHDTESGAEVYALNQGWVAPNRGTVVFYNNVAFNTVASPVSLFADGVASDLHFKLWNNSLKANASGHCIRASFEGAPTLGSIDARNNHLISDGDAFCYNGSSADCGFVALVTDQNNLIQTHAQATAAGYTTANLLQPTSGSSSTVDNGQNLSSVGFMDDRFLVTRPKGDQWDRGAYEQVDGGPGGDIVAPTISFTGATNRTPWAAVIKWHTDEMATNAVRWNGTGSFGTNGNTTFTMDPQFLITNLHTATLYNVMVLSWDASTNLSSNVISFTTAPVRTNLVNIPAESGVLEGVAWPTGSIMESNATAPGYISVTNQITDPTLAGTARYWLYSATSTNYIVTVSVDAPNLGANSIYITFDSTNIETTTVCDITNVTSGFETRTVVWRGNGNSTNPTVVPKLFPLTVGIHRMEVGGREPNMLIDTWTVAAEGIAVIDTNDPIVSLLTVVDIAATGSRVTWTTDEPADSHVLYWITGGSTNEVVDQSLVTSHSVTLSSLVPATTYNYFIMTMDASENATTSSPPGTFTTVPNLEAILQGALRFEGSTRVE